MVTLRGIARSSWLTAGKGVRACVVYKMRLGKKLKYIQADPQSYANVRNGAGIQVLSLYYGVSMELYELHGDPISFRGMRLTISQITNPGKLESPNIP